MNGAVFGSIVGDVMIERWRQEELHGADKSCANPAKDNYSKLAILTEEVGEVARDLLDGPTDNLRTELVQVAAVAVAWVEALDRG